MKKVLLTLGAVAMMASQLSAQINIDGSVVDHKTGEPMPFVNIAITGTTLGTISNIDGAFHLTVPDNMGGRELTFSSVGYSTVTAKIGPSVINQQFDIKLEPIDFKINEVLVVDKSEAGRKLVKDVLDKVSNNYVDCDFAYSGNYVCECNTGGPVMTSTYKFNAYDSDGYSNECGNAFEALNYKFQSVERNFKVDNYAKGLNYFDMASGLDIVRNRLGVLNRNALGSFDFSIKSDDGNICKVEFECKEPSLSATGALNPTRYKGFIIIDKKKNLVREAYYELDVDRFSQLGLSVEGSGKARVECKVVYDEFYGKYSLKSLESNVFFGDGQSMSNNIYVNSLNYKIPGKISGKVFYSR